MAHQLHAWRSWFWDADFWLPTNMTWEVLDEAKNPKWVNIGELYLSFPVAIILIILRVVFERFIASPVVHYLGVKDKPILFVPNTFCEKVYQTISKDPSAERLEGLSKQLGWSSRQVKKWFRNRRQQSKPSVMKKARESSWRFVFYLGTSVYGFAILLKEPWLFDLRLCFAAHGKQPLTDEIFYYYLVEVGFYLSLLISLFVDVKRKDFWQMVIHHIVTILLTSFSYTTGFFRIGAVIILLHDLSDVFLESAKVFNYAKWENTCSIMFVLFAVIFNVGRLVYYPFWVLHAIYHSQDICGPFRSWLLFMGLLSSLQILHLYWSYKIAEMVYELAVKKKIEGDVRSDEESWSEPEEKPETSKQDGVAGENKKKQ